jgi:hypothetical protein
VCSRSAREIFKGGTRLLWDPGDRMTVQWKRLLKKLYNNTPSKAIVNAVSNITYRPLIEVVDTGR